MHLFTLCCHPKLIINMLCYISWKKKHPLSVPDGDEKQEFWNCAFLCCFLKMVEAADLGKHWLKSQPAWASTSAITLLNSFCSAAAGFAPPHHSTVTPPPTSSSTTIFSKKSDYYTIHSGLLLISLWLRVLSLLESTHCAVHLSLNFSLLFNIYDSALT